MKRPRLKRNRHNYVLSADFPVDKFLKDCPLPPALAHLEPIMRGSLGQALITSIATCLDEGFTYTQLEAVTQQIIDFYAEEWHRCAACHGWAKDFAAGAVILDGQFKLTVICAKCGHLVASGRTTKSMDKNVAEFIFGGEA